MLKRMLTVIIVSCFLPVMAHAATWSLTTLLKTTGGAILVDSNPLQTAVNVSVTSSYTYTSPADTKTVTVIPNPGYTISKVIYNGVSMLNPTQTSFTVNGPTSQSVTAYFTLRTYSITATVVDSVGGGVSPASVGNLANGKILTTPYIFTYTPTSAAFTLGSLTGVPADITTPVLPANPGQAVSITFPTGYVITSDIALVGTFTSQYPVAKAVSSAPAYVGKTVTLDGSGSRVTDGVNISSYLWTQISGPAVTFSNAAALTSFIPTVAGTYVFSLKLMPGGSSASTTVTVYADANQYVLDKCQNCHIGSGNNITVVPYQKWAISKHQLNYILCANCHSGADTGEHPGLLRSGAVSETTFSYTTPTGGSNFCVTCHNPSIVTDFAASKHAVRAGAASCSFCHVNGVHNPAASCTDCHKADNAFGLVWPPAGFAFHSSFVDTKECRSCHSLHNPKTFSFDIKCTQ